MARAGSTFESLMEEDEAPAPTLARHLSPQQRLRAQESANARETFRQNQEEEKRKKAEFGTTDRDKIMALKETGALDDDFAARAQMDPEWAKAAVQRAYEISGLAPGAKDVGDMGAGPAPRTYSVGKGAHGEQYFTNLSRGELHAENRDRNAMRDKAGLPNEEPPVTDLTSMPGLRDEPRGTTPSNDPADILFRERLEKAGQIAGQNDVDLKKYANVVDETEKLLADHKDIATARETVQKRLMDGTYGKKGFTPRDVAGIDKLLISRVKDPLKEPNADWTFYKPMHDADSMPGVNANPALPATILNPGGAKPALETAQAMNSRALADTASHIDEAAPSELPRTFQYATMSPTARRMQKQARETKLSRASEPANPLLGRLESDRASEIKAAEGELGNLSSGVATSTRAMPREAISFPARPETPTTEEDQREYHARRGTTKRSKKGSRSSQKYDVPGGGKLGYDVDFNDPTGLKRLFGF